MTPTHPRSATITAPAGMRDAWLQRATPRGPWTWAELKRQFRVFVPAVESKTLCATLRQWGASPEDLEPLLRLVRAIVLSNAAHRALDIVERVIAELERLIQWEFTPPIVLHEHDAKHKPTHRTVRLTRLDEGMRAVFAKARMELLWVRELLRRDTQRPRGRKATLVQPDRVSAVPKAARRRDLVRIVCAEILALHPERTTRPRAARAQAERLARDIIAAIPVLK